MTEDKQERRWPRHYYAREDELYEKKYRRCSPTRAKRAGVQAMRTWKGHFDKSLTKESYAKLYDVD